VRLRSITHLQAARRQLWSPIPTGAENIASIATTLRGNFIIAGSGYNQQGEEVHPDDGKTAATAQASSTRFGSGLSTLSSTPLRVETYKVHTVLIDNGTHFTTPGNTSSAAPDIKAALEAGELVWAHAFE
jgi:hypothetical protein